MRKKEIKRTKRNFLKILTIYLKISKSKSVGLHSHSRRHEMISNHKLCLGLDPNNYKI